MDMSWEETCMWCVRVLPCFMYITVHTSLYRFAFVYTYVFICLFVCLSIYLSIHLSIYLSISLGIKVITFSEGDWRLFCVSRFGRFVVIPSEGGSGSIGIVRRGHVIRDLPKPGSPMYSAGGPGGVQPGDSLRESRVWGWTLVLIGVTGLKRFAELATYVYVCTV